MPPRTRAARRGCATSRRGSIPSSPVTCGRAATTWVTILRRSQPWRPRKETYLADLPGHGRNAIIVSMGDKVHNARAIWTDLLNGVDVQAKFKPEADILWYYGECLTIAEQFDVPLAVRTPLSQAIEGIRAELDARALASAGRSQGVHAE